LKRSKVEDIASNYKYLKHLTKVAFTH